MRTTALVTACTLAACSSQYAPQSRRHVAMMVRDGKYVFVRDGKIYEHGLLGGGLVDAVQGNPAAVAAAGEYHSRMQIGFVTMLAGGAVSIGGIAYSLVTLASTDQATSSTSRNAGIGLAAMLGGLVVLAIGGGYLATAEPYRWDAINLFNDNADMTRDTAPGLSARKMTLDMRGD